MLSLAEFKPSAGRILADYTPKLSLSRPEIYSKPALGSNTHNNNIMLCNYLCGTVSRPTMLKEQSHFTNQQGCRDPFEKTYVFRFFLNPKKPKKLGFYVFL